jgi:hypothetical protein
MVANKPCADELKGERKGEGTKGGKEGGKRETNKRAYLNMHTIIRIQNAPT